MRRAFLSVSIVVVLVGAFFATATVARQSRTEPDVLGALLVEVRGLRAAIEHLGSAGPRVQVAMGRLQLNEQRIASYVKRLDEIRDRRVAAERSVRDYQRKLAEFVEAWKDAVIDAPAAEELKRHKSELDGANAILARLQEEEVFSSGLRQFALRARPRR